MDPFAFLKPRNTFRGIETLRQNPLYNKYYDEIYPEYGSPEEGLAIGPYGSPEEGLAIGPYLTPDSFTGTGFYGNTDMGYPSAPANRLQGLDLSRFQGVSDLGKDDEDVEQVEYLPGAKPTGLGNLLQYLPFGDKSIFKRGLEGLSNFIPRSDPRAVGIRNFYRPYEGITNTGAVASGLMAGYNPVSGFGKNKKFGLSRAMQKRIERIEETLKKKDSQQLRDRASKLRELQRQEMQDRFDRGESLSDIGKSTFTGKGMAFEKRSGGKSIVDGKERNYGGR
jgi:hypothetical protein|tara:strand:- start:5382 stop:6221 length:840 start_codon:yes stop_codon:yes gene_type:complete